MIKTAEPMDPLLKRPFYFILALWGDEFRSLFLDTCLPSLLAPGNIPALANKTGARFLLATTQDDWAKLCTSPLIARLQEHVRIELIEIPTPKPGDDKFAVMTRAHKIASDMAIAAEAYGVFLCPDALLSDGSVAHLQHRAIKGAKVVLVAALRHTQETFLPQLYKHPAYKSNAPLALTPRELMRLSLLHLHEQVLYRDWDSDHFSACPGYAFWRAPDGIILHNTRWGPLLFSYADLEAHDTTNSYFGEGYVSVDDDYVYRNYGVGDHIHVVTDSDDLTYVSLTSERVAAREATVSGERNKLSCLRVNAHSGIMDPLQWNLFPLHIRMHAGELSAVWAEKERKIETIIRQCMRKPGLIDRVRLQIAIYGIRRLVAATIVGPLSKLKLALWPPSASNRC